MCNFSVDCNTIDISDIVDIHKYLIKQHNVVEMHGLFKQTFIVLVLVLLGLLLGSLTTKCVSVNNQACMVRPNFVGLNPDKFNYYSFIISLDRRDESHDTVENPFGRICIPDKIEHVNLKVFNMIKRINKPKTLTHFSPIFHFYTL